MKSKFFLFSSHLELAHQYWEKLLEPTDTAIDATCGNGHDTLKLAKILLNGQVLALDIQKKALQAAQKLLNPEELKRTSFHLQSHENFPPSAAPKLIIYNLGYLPGSDKTLTTLTTSTLISVQKALELVCLGGAVSITCYPGHPEGKKEEEALVKLCSSLDPKVYSVCHHRFLNRTDSPSLILIQKKILYLHHFPS